MTIQRQYSLPNCRLILEGLSEHSTLDSNVQPLMSILLNAQCYVTGLEQPLSGGLEFFQRLVMAVSHYAQEMLSGVRSPIFLEESQSNQAPWVKLEPISSNLHRLSVLSEESSSQSNPTNPTQLELTTVQLFDLIEAVDQFFADQNTLPTLRTNFTPVSKQYLTTREPVAKKVVPLAVGVSGLAIAATAFFMAPTPEIKRPTEDPATQPTADEVTEAVTTNTTAGSSSPPETNNSVSPLSSDELETLLDRAPEITDPTKLTILQQQLRNQIVEAWTTEATFTEELIYQVSIAKDGAMVGYKPENDAARDYVEQTPLSQIVYKPPGGGTASVEEIGLFKVVLQPNGVPEVSPWKGLTGTPTPPPELEDSQLVETLFNQLADQLTDEWKTQPTFRRDLIYKLLVTEDGAIADYQPQNQPARDYLDQTPLRQLHQPSTALTKDSDGNLTYVPVVTYRVVFTPRKVLQISPWEGW